MVEAASMADAAMAIFVSTADKAVAEAVFTTDEASLTDEAATAHHLKTRGGSESARTC